MEHPRHARSAGKGRPAAAGASAVACHGRMAASAPAGGRATEYAGHRGALGNPCDTVRHSPQGWQAVGSDGQVLAEAGQLIVAGGFHTRALMPDMALPLNPLRG